MKRNLLVFAILFACSCGGNKLIGEYCKIYSDSKYSLQLNKDHTFLLKEQSFEADAQCRGKWSYFSRDTLLLECEKEKPLEMFAQGRINERIQKVAILNKRQIKIKQVILTKK